MSIGGAADDGRTERGGGAATVALGRQTGAQTGPQAGPQAAPGTGETEGAGGGGSRRARPLRIGAVLLVLALLAAGVALYVQGRALRDTPATANLALTDVAATARVTGDVSSALGQVFSYDPETTADTKGAARRLLAGEALKQYAALFGQVEKQAADQRLTLTTRVVRAGVTRLTDDSAHLLVFLDQVYERAGKAATTAAAQLSVTAEKRGGIWMVVDLTSR